MQRMDPVVSLRERNGTVLVKLRGDVRVEAAAQLLLEAAQADPQKDAVVDWEQAEHVDTCVFQVLLSFQQRLAESGRSLKVEKDNPHVREYLRLAGLSDLFPVRPAQSPVASRENPDG
jgi:anti-anti-sigma factor